MKSQVFFVDDKLRKSFEQLKESKTEDQRLHDWIAAR
jgi:hypothetical protein